MFELKIGSYIITTPYSKDDDKIGIYLEGDEGGDFSIEEFEKVVRKFYVENF